MRRAAKNARARRRGIGRHGLDARRGRADHRPLSGKAGSRATSPSRRAIRTRCARRSSPATCCWSKATTTFPASSNTSRNRPGRMPRSMSGRSATATRADGEPLVLVEANIGQGVVGRAAVEIRALPHPHLPPDRADRRRSRARLRLRRRAHRLRLRPEEHLRPAALSVPAAGAAALAPAHDGARLGPSDPHHLLGADRAGLRDRALSDPAEGDAAGKRGGARAKFWKSAIRRSTRRAISTSRPISQVVKPTIEQRLRLQGAWPGPTCRAPTPTSWRALAPASSQTTLTPSLALVALRAALPLRHGTPYLCRCGNVRRRRQSACRRCSRRRCARCC